MASQRARRLEFGSWFHLEDQQPIPDIPRRNIQLYGSGRDALRALVRASASQVRRIVVPTYYCHEVSDLLRHEIDVRLYDCTPFADALQLEIEDDEMAIVVEYFGCKSNVTVKGGRFVVDRTMLPWSGHQYLREPSAVFGSLRKAFPVPDGGFLSAPVLDAVQIPSLPAHEAKAHKILGAMRAKRLFLEGEDIDRDEFLAVLGSVDSWLASGKDLTGASNYTAQLMRSVRVADYSEPRRRNLRLLRHMRPSAWDGLSWSAAESHAVLHCETPELRNRVRARLAGLAVYSPILWPIPHTIGDSRAVEFSNHVLIIHVDHRYAEPDIEELARRIEIATLAK